MRRPVLEPEKILPTTIGLLDQKRAREKLSGRGQHGGIRMASRERSLKGEM